MTTFSTLAVDAVDLWKAYYSSEVDADRRFKGKRLSVTGTVRAARDESGYDVVLELKGPTVLESTRATLGETEAAQAAALAKGQRVALLCTGNGRILQSPSLIACTLQ